MTQADSVHSTPPLNTPIGAPGAVQLSPPSLIPGSHPPACQGVKNVPEPSAGLTVQSGGAAMNRRSLMNMMVGAAAVAGTAIPQPATATNDPIFAAIEAHKTARAELMSVFEIHSRLDRELPIDKCRSSVTAYEEKIVETDDPRWIECERAMMRAYDTEDNAAIELVCIQPTTRAGFVALIEHALAYDTDGAGWPTELKSDDGQRIRSWHWFLLESLLASKAVLMEKSGIV
jgi:hypothetical protein